MPISIRNVLFQMYRYSPVTTFGRHYNDLSSFYRSHNFRHRKITERLNRLLRHAVGTTGYYKPFQNYSSLQDFPVIQKSHIKENLDDFLSENYPLESLKTSSTSGSYGSPFVCYLTKDKKVRQLAEVIFFSELVGFRAGMKHIHIASRKPSALNSVLLNQILKNPSVIGEQWLEDLKNKLSNGTVRFIVGYTSALTLFAEYCVSNAVHTEKFNLRGIIVIAEPLPKSRKNFLEKVFGCTVTSRYASMETGLIAQQLPGNDRFTVNTGSYFVEILRRDSDLPVKPGEPGRLVITDYFSHALPLIRYDIGDIGVSGSNMNGGIEELESIEGRQVEMITKPDGTLISPMAIDDIMEAYTDISQFQFIQENVNTYKLKIVEKSGDVPYNEIRKRFTQMLGCENRFDIQTVRDIPALASGKRPYVINNTYFTNAIL